MEIRRACLGHSVVPSNIGRQTEWQTPTCTFGGRKKLNASYPYVVAPWHVSTFVTPEKHLYPHDYDGTGLSQLAARANLTCWIVRVSSYATASDNDDRNVKTHDGDDG